MGSIRHLVEQYTTLGLVTVPVSGKRPVSVVLDEHGQPLRRPDGSPVRWQPFIERPPSDAELEAFEWEKATGLAVVIGRASWQAWPYLWCLDIETAFRGEAEQWLDQHVPEWRAGVVVETGGGGLHVYFLSPHPVATGVVRWGEVRGQGSLCVLPPSWHPETGRTYRWLSERWTNLPQLEPTAVPGYGGRAENGHQVEPLDVGRVLEGVPLGQRNQTLFRLACKLRGAGIPLEWATRLVTEAASRCTPPWGSGPDEEPVERLVERVYSRYQPNPTLVVANGKDEFISPTIECDVGETNSIPDSWQPVPISELGTDTVGVEWLWDGLLAKGHLTDLVGLWKGGKSTFIGALLQRLGHGGELAGRVVRPGKALVVTEEPRVKWLERREALALGDHVHIVSRPFPKRPNHAEWHAFTAYISRLVVERAYDLVVVDSLPNLWSVADENNAAEVISALLPLQGVASAGCAVLILRHPRKSDGGQATAGRGSGAIAGLVDIIIEMRRYDPDQLQDTRRVLSVYSRYEPFEVVIRWNGGGDYETLGSPAAYSAEAQRERLLEALAELGVATTSELAKAVELPHATVSRRLSELEAAGLVVRTGSGKRGAPYRWSLASGDDDPDGDGFFSPTNALIVGEKKTGDDLDGDDFFSPTDAFKVGETKNPRETDFPRGEAKNGGSGSVGFFSPTDTSIVGETKNEHRTPHSDGAGASEPNGRHSPGDSSQLVEQGPPDDVIAWGEWLLAELRAGQVQLPVIELKPGRSVVAPERFLASHLAEARLGIGVAVENLQLFRRVLERAGMGRVGKGVTDDGAR
jgi:hypothetical protein